MANQDENDTERLNRILEESLEVIFQNDVPNFLDTLSTSISSLETNQNQNQNQTTIMDFLRDFSFNSVVPSLSNTQNLGIHIPNTATNSDTMNNRSMIPNHDNHTTTSTETTLVPTIVPNETTTIPNSSINTTTTAPTTPIQNSIDAIPNTGEEMNPSNSYIPVPSERYLDMFDDFTSRWFRYVESHQEQMRLYQQNTLQMIRVSQTLTRILQVNMRPFQARETASTHTPTSPPIVLSSQQNTLMPPHVRDFLSRNGFNIDVQGFSIPLPTLLRQAITSGTADPSPSFPTIRQIMDNTERFILNQDNSIRIDDTRCPISLEDFQVGEELCEIKHCHHVFKWSSLQNWFSRNSHCPVCRHDIRTNPIQNQSQSQSTRMDFL